MKIDSKEFEDLTLLEVSGRIGWQNSLVLNHEIKKQVERGIRKVLLCLANIPFFSSAAIAILASNAKKFRDQGSHFYIISDEIYIKDILQTTGIQHVLGAQIFQSVDQLTKELNLTISEDLVLQTHTVNTEEFL